MVIDCATCKRLMLPNNPAEPMWSDHWQRYLPPVCDTCPDKVEEPEPPVIQHQHHADKVTLERLVRLERMVYELKAKPGKDNKHIGGVGL